MLRNSLAYPTALSVLLLAALSPACGTSPTDGDGSGSGSKGSGSSSGSGSTSSGSSNNGTGSIDFGTGGGTTTECEPGTVEVCGDGILTCSEGCDDGNTKADDGCAADCKSIDAGFICPKPGEECRPFAKCGDGIVRFPEQCDDGNDADQDGCSSNCKVDIGFKCSGEPSVCSATDCGNFELEAPGESCDDGNTIPFDGCDARCQTEPNCGNNGCAVKCGDGIVMPPETCDDGNTTKDDGCSKDCKIEEGYECTQAPCEKVGDSCVLRVPAVFRDFDSGDFVVGCGTQIDGIANDTLNSSGKPTLKSNAGDTCIASGTSFGQWYVNVDGVNKANPGSIVLFDNGSGGFVNRYGALGDKYNGKDGNPLFFPVDEGDLVTPTSHFHAAKIPAEIYGGSWNWEGKNYNNDPEPTDTPRHNFGFSSEVTYWFQYDSSKSATLTFAGDDDVWVFINRKLAVDLGGLHVPMQEAITISSANAATFGLVDGKVYEIKVFHAERKANGSSFQLTLSGFDTSRSSCKAKCGDGIVGAGEECDDGVNDGGYNECQANCVLGGYCGDGIKQEAELCDDKDPNNTGSCIGCRPIKIQ